MKAATHDHRQRATSSTTEPRSTSEPEAEAATDALAAPVPLSGLAQAVERRAVQRKVVVGAAQDPSELEADRVATAVLSALRRGNPDGAAAPEVQRHDLQRHGLQRHGERGHSPGAIGLAGGDVDAATEDALRGASSGGRRLPDALRGRLESVMDADLSGIRIHTGEQSTALNRTLSASAFTHGRDIHFRDGMPDVSSDAGLHLLVHELAHTVQQGAAPTRDHDADASAHAPADGAATAHDLGRGHAQRVLARDFAGAIGIRRSTGGPVIQRHAAFEHYLLGQLHPSEIKKIPEVRKINDNPGQKANTKSGHGGGLEEGAATKKLRNEVKHLLDQEMDRLLEFKDTAEPPAMTDRAGEKGQVKRELDGHWQIPIVVLTCLGGDEVVVSYSEMNTMPDLFGNPEAIAKTPKASVLALLQGVRQQLYIELSKIREELFGDSRNQLHNTVTLDADFEGATGPRSQEATERGEKAFGAYEKRTEMQVNSATKQGTGGAQEEYFAALERNACHFAPESWRQWRGYHDEAVKLAKQSWLEKVASTALGLNPVKKKEHEDAAAKLANDALIQNSFGEHYLQDSFAAGHLIDKTKIMQWFALWLERNNDDLGTKSAAKAQWAMSLYAAKQNLKSNPQRLHDKGVRGALPSATAASDEIGMDSDDPDMLFMMKWRRAAAGKSKYKTLTPDTAEEATGVKGAEATGAMINLVQKGFAKRAGKNKWSIKQEHIDAFKKGTGGAYTAERGKNVSGMDDEEAVAEFNVAAYNTLMSNAYLQSSTKFFHDKFCKEGLQVMSGENVELGRIYGDANMLNAGGQKGLEYAAETSRQSRSAVFSLINGGPEFANSAAIARRFPNKVKAFGKFVPITEFNTILRDLGNTTYFAEAKSVGAKIVYKAKNGISSKGALDVEKLTSAMSDAIAKDLQNEAQPF